MARKTIELNLSEKATDGNPDKLEKILILQQKLNERLGVTNSFYDKSKQHKVISDLCFAAIHELTELHDETNWKWWKQYPQQDKEQLQRQKTEIIDVLHFVISLALTIGMDANEIYQEYVNKNKINNQRQDNGY